MQVRTGKGKSEEHPPSRQANVAGTLTLELFRNAESLRPVGVQTAGVTARCQHRWGTVGATFRF